MEASPAPDFPDPAGNLGRRPHQPLLPASTPRTSKTPLATVFRNRVHVCADWAILGDPRLQLATVTGLFSACAGSWDFAACCSGCPADVIVPLRRVRVRELCWLRRLSVPAVLCLPRPRPASETSQCRRRGRFRVLRSVFSAAASLCFASADSEGLECCSSDVRAALSLSEQHELWRCQRRCREVGC